MRVLVVGNGGREHALLWKIARDAPEAELFVTLGNGGTPALARSIPLAPEEIQPLAAWAEKERIDLTVVGPEVPLSLGIADQFAARGLPVFGPTRAAAEIESSKAYAKLLMQRFDIPTAGFATFTDPLEAERYIRSHPDALVVKASGLAAGKGAVVCATPEEAVETARAMLGGMALGEAGREIVVEELMRGEELSVLALTDGERVVPLLPAQDHKRLGEGDQGPNTGGMGAYAPVSIATHDLLARVRTEILEPTVRALAEEGRPFRGLLYAGVMLTETGIRVVEFNCRFGDPETQVILPLVSGSLLAPMLAIARGEGLEPWLGGIALRDAAAVTTVLAAAGYPGDYRKGVPLTVPDALGDRGDVLVFHAGTALRDGQLVTSGGRVLAVTGIGGTTAEAAAVSREAVASIGLPGGHFRKDIGWREIARA